MARLAFSAQLPLVLLLPLRQCSSDYLYDLTADPLESVDLYDAMPTVRSVLGDRLEELGSLVERTTPCPANSCENPGEVAEVVWRRAGGAVPWTDYDGPPPKPEI